MSEVWAQWEGQVVNGEYPLRRCLGVSDHSGVFLTEIPALNLPEAALKLVPLIPTLAESQLAHWNAAAALSHPHLIRLFATGRCQLGTRHCLYVLMEYAEQNLAHLLRNRPLTDIEARDLLPPALDALAFLHSRNQLQGQLRPSNILVVGEQLKLASDTIRPAGEAATSISMTSVYDPPEARDGSFSTAGDIWALGVTLYEALTQTTPEKPGERSHGVVLPPDFPPGSADVIQECLSRRPGDRPSVMNLLAWIRVRPRQETVPVARAAAPASQSPMLETVAASAPGPFATAAGTAYVPSPAASRGSAAAAAGQAPTLGTSQAVASPHSAAVSLRQAIAAPMQGAAAVPVLGVVAPVQGAAAGPAQTAAVGPAQVAGSPQPGTQSTVTASNGVNEPPGRLTIRAVVERDPPQQHPFEKRSFLRVALGAVVVIAAGWFGVRYFTGTSDSTAPEANTSQAAPAAPDATADSAGAARGSQPGDSPQLQNAAPSRSAPQSQSATPSRSAPLRNAPTPPNRSAPTTSASSDSAPAPVVHEEMPNVSHNALSTVRGRVKVTVRVTVDQSGNVVSDTLESAGPSKYFARAASEAARKWRFAAAPGNAARTWLVRFEFSRSGATGHVVTGS